MIMEKSEHLNIAKSEVEESYMVGILKKIRRSKLPLIKTYIILYEDIRITKVVLLSFITIWERVEIM